MRISEHAQHDGTLGDEAVMPARQVALAAAARAKAASLGWDRYQARLVELIQSWLDGGGLS